jgi:hypothetical protein
MKFYKWFAGFFEDQKGSASSKRAVLYWAMSLLTYMVVKSTIGATMNMEVFFGILGLVIVGLGLTTSEFFKHLPGGNKLPDNGNSKTE